MKMRSAKVMFIILQGLIVQSMEFQNKHPFLSKLANPMLFKHDFKYTTPEYYDQSKRNNCMSKNASVYRHNGTRHVRFTDRNSNDSNEENEMEALTAKDSVFDLLTEEGEGEEEENEDDKLQIKNGEVPEEKHYQKVKVKNNKIKENLKKDDDNENVDDEDYDLDFWSDDDNDNSKKKVDDINISASKDKAKDEGKWPHHKFYKRKKFHNLMLPILLAYKLKFFSVIPLLLGVLVLLLGTTTMAGFFFALFSAALGLHNTHFHY